MDNIHPNDIRKIIIAFINWLDDGHCISASQQEQLLKHMNEHIKEKQMEYNNG